MKYNFKIELSTANECRTITKCLSKINIKCHTNQLPEERNLSVIIKNTPTCISEETIINVFFKLNLNVTSITHLKTLT